MVFLSICTALYDYVPQAEGELPIREGELVYIIEKSTEDEWWKAKKKAPGEEEEEPVGLIPNNYVEETQPSHHAKALYDYSRQTDEELSFSEDASLLVYDTSDPDWTLVGLNGEFGFAPANYIEITSEAERDSPISAISPPLPERHTERELPPTPTSAVGSPTNPAAALAGILNKQNTGALSKAPRSPPSTTSPPPTRPQFTPEASDEDNSEPPPPSLPERPKSQQISPPRAHLPPPQSPEHVGVIASPPYNRARHGEDIEQPSPGGFHLYNINEMVSAMGKQKKMPTTLGINLATGNIMIAPEKSLDGPQQEWTADKLAHYSIEGKHIFMELVRPSKSVDFHAGAKDTAQEIVASLGELAGAAKAEGLREIFAASSGSGKSERRGHILYDFMAQGDDEVTVAVGDEVIVLDDSNEEWWQVRRVKNGKEGVVPGSYVEATGMGSPPSSSMSGLNAGRSTVEQNRLEEQRQTKEALRSGKRSGGNESKGLEVGPGMKLPTRGSSLMGGQDDNKLLSQRKRDSRQEAKSSTYSSKSKPDVTRTRTWTDRSGSFKVEAEFIGLKDGKIHLHKLNGVKIAVPVVKMAIEDLEYVERVTGVSLDEDKPLSDIRRRSQKEAQNKDKTKVLPLGPSIGESVAAQQPKKPEYEWFDFFLKCGVSPYQCERYSSNFIRDSMDEAVLPDITPTVLNTLGLKQGDILRVMKYLDNKFGRSGAKSKLRNVSFGGEEVIKNDEEDDGGLTSPGGGLFSGPGGALKNNTRKGRPAPAIQTNDTIDPKAFQQAGSTKEYKPVTKDQPATPSTETSTATAKTSSGFDDDAWDVKPAKQASTPASPPVASAPAPALIPSNPPQPPLTGSMADLSLLSQPLQPVIAHSTGALAQTQNQQSTLQPQLAMQQAQAQNQPQQQQQFLGASQQSLQQQPTGASPSFFASLGAQVNGAQNYNPQAQAVQNFTSQPTDINQIQGYNSQAPSMQPLNSHPTGVSQPQFQLNAAPLQRLQAPQFNQQGSLMPPPPPRPLSAPQNASPQNNFGPLPLQPQLTGVPAQGGYQQQLASPSQSLNEINKLRLQQQFAQQQQPLQAQLTGFNQQSQPYNQYGNALGQQPNTYGQQPHLMPQPTALQSPPPYLNGQQTGSPFADPRSQVTGSFQPLSTNITGFSSAPYGSLVPQQTGSINSMLPPALQPQQTGVNGFNGLGFGQSQPPPPIPPMPHMPHQQVTAPLQPQKTGPAPPVKFGVANDVKRLLPQATGRKANLSQATPQNPFGF